MSKKVILILFIITLFLELIVFNINSFRTFGEGEVLLLEDANLIGLEKTEDGYLVQGNEAAIEWEDLNKDIKTIFADIEISGENRISFESRISYTDDTAKYYYDEEKLKTKEIVNGVDKTKYFTCHFSGNVEKLKLEILYSPNCSLHIEEIVINRQIPYTFSIVRLIVVFGTMLLVYAIFKAQIFNQIYDKTNTNQSAILKVLAVVFIYILFVYTINSNIYFGFSKTEGDIYNKSLVDALLNGNVSLNIKPSEELVNMENPYDYTARKEENISYLYDYAYYNGNYYVYFSVLPVLTLFLPFKVLTGYYFPIGLACVIYASIGGIFTILVTKNTLKKFYPNIEFRWIFLGSIFMLFSNFIIFNVAMSRVYELVSIFGYMFAMIGIYFLIRTRETEKINYKFLTISCMFLALAVWARPNLVIVSFLLVPTLLKILKENKKERVKLILSVAIPYIIIAVMVMIYNYLRFGSIIEFGAQYQLTSNDMSKLGYKLSTVPIGIWHYLFNPFKILCEFPFIHKVDSTPLYVGFYGNGCKGVGIFSLNILMYTLFLLPILRKNIKEKNKVLWNTLRNLVVVGLAMVIIITLMAASYGRYSIDFAWMFVLATILLLMYIKEEVSKNEFATRLFKIIVSSLIVISVFINLLESINSEKNLFKLTNTQNFYKYDSIICFWK